MRPWLQLVRETRDFFRFRRELPGGLARASANAHRALADEVTVRVRCGLCGRTLETLQGSADGADMRASGGPGVEPFAGPGRPRHGGLLNRSDIEGLLRAGELRRYRCPRQRCMGDFPVKWDKLTTSFVRAAAGASKRERVIRIPDDVSVSG